MSVTRPKPTGPRGGIQLMERDLLGQATLPNTLTDHSLTASRESKATLLEWRSTGAINLSETGEWHYQTVMCSQTFEGLPNQFEQLNIGSHQPTKYPWDGHFTLAKDGCKTRAKWFQPRHWCHGHNHHLPESMHPHLSNLFSMGPQASKLSFFLNRAWSYIDQHEDEFHDDREIVSILGDNLEEEASE
ncbi:hypothetical protein E2320_022478 [Naja naja]|nr:hypothetical protein E2320_022478 [Naja naja]